MLELLDTGNIKALYLYLTIRIIVILICWISMTTGCLIDLWTARDTAKACGEKLESHKYRRTITKIGDYARVMLFAFMFDMLGLLLTFYKLPFGTILCTIAILMIEGKSVVENLAKKRSHAADIPETVKQIISANTITEAKKILKNLEK